MSYALFLDPYDLNLMDKQGGCGGSRSIPSWCTSTRTSSFYPHVRMSTAYSSTKLQPRPWIAAPTAS
eukprot:2028649-Pyramimonas_sp.AAC.3